MLDNVDLRGYTAWSLLDNFEWASGYGPRFGLFEVDFEDDSRPRKQKRSSLFYKYDNFNRSNYNGFSQYLSLKGKTNTVAFRAP